MIRPSTASGRATGILAAGFAFVVAFFALCGNALAEDPGAIAEIHSAKSNKEEVTGKVLFYAADGGVRIVADINGLKPGKHGFHIHEKPDLSDPDLKSAGGHFNPGGAKHGGPDSETHHAGDLGNLVADEKGHATLDRVIKGLSISGEKDGVVGHSVIIHAGEDDLKSDPAGNSGARIAGGVIDLARKP